MTSSSADLRLRVILVTTRAALRHVRNEPEQRRAVVGRGRKLLEDLAASAAPLSDGDSEAIRRAHQELELLAER